MKPVSAGVKSQAALHAKRPADAGKTAIEKLTANKERLKDNPQAVAGMEKALARLKANAERFKATEGSTIAQPKSDLGVG